MLPARDLGGLRSVPAHALLFPSVWKLEADLHEVASELTEYKSPGLAVAFGP